VYVGGPGRRLRQLSPVGGVLLPSEKPVSPDGKWVVGKDASDTWTLYATDGGEPRPVVGIAGREHIAQWTDDGRLYGYNGSPFPLHLFKLHPAPAKPPPLRALQPP